uniref:F-box domain-containing protein n=1 Tax=Panagrolaimus davidi TaxID=227884 RepID=A0A914PN68_9BILA
MDLSEKVTSLPIQTQYFPFFPNFMKYILQNSSPKLLLKLYQSCKYFYFKLRIIIAQNVWYNNYPEKKEMEMEIMINGEYYHDYPNVEKFWLCDKLHIKNVYKRTIKGPSFNYGLIGNVFLNKIYRNNLKELSICSGFTLLKELEILSKSPFLTKVILQTFVKNENDEPIPIEEIIFLFPNIKKFEIDPTYFTMESFEKLLTFKFLNKIYSLEFWNVETEFNTISMCKFLQGIFDENADFVLTFDSSQVKNQLLPRVKEIIDGWKTN